MIGSVYNAPIDVVDSGRIVVVGKDSDPLYHATRKPWFVQVREFVDGVAVGPWLPVTLDEFKEWNPNAPVTTQQWVALGNKGRAPELC